MRKIRKGDDIVVIAGKDKGKRATVTSVIGSKVLVQGVNIVKKHQKPNPSSGASGGIIEIAKPINISNIAIFNFSTKRPDRVGFKLDDKNRKIRVFKSTGEQVGN